MNLCRSGSLAVLLLAMALTPAGFTGYAATTNYAGLVYSGNPNVSAQSGIFVLFVSPNQKFSGEILIGRRFAGFHGRFDTNGAADFVVRTTVDNSCYSCDPPIIDIETQAIWDVHFQLSPAGDSIS